MRRGMYGRPESDPARNNYEQHPNRIKIAAARAAALPENKSDPFYYRRLFNLLKNDLDDLHEIEKWVDNKVKNLTGVELAGYKEFLQFKGLMFEG